MAQLKISDLSVGDWVEFHRTKGIYIAPPLFEKANARVIGTHRGAEVSLLVDGKREFIAMPLSAIHPIPITPEILEKNGSKKTEFVKDSGYEFYRCDDFYASRVEGSKWWTIIVRNECREVVNCYVQHVHQLQHVLRLAGVEKEIEL